MGHLCERSLLDGSTASCCPFFLACMQMSTCCTRHKRPRTHRKKPNSWKVFGKQTLLTSYLEQVAAIGASSGSKMTEVAAEEAPHFRARADCDPHSTFKASLLPSNTTSPHPLPSKSLTLNQDQTHQHHCESAGLYLCRFSKHS